MHNTGSGANANADAVDAAVQRQMNRLSLGERSVSSREMADRLTPLQTDGPEIQASDSNPPPSSAKYALDSPVTPSSVKAEAPPRGRSLLRSMQSKHMSASSPDLLSGSKTRNTMRKVASLNASGTMANRVSMRVDAAFQRGSSLMGSTRDLMKTGSRMLSARMPRRKPKVKRSQIKTATEIMAQKRQDLLSSGQVEITDSRSWRAASTRSVVPERHPCCVLRPQSPVRLAWDLMTLVLLMYIAIATPFQIGFSVDATGFLFWLEKLVDVFFISDLMLNFRTGIVSGNGEEVLEPCKIAKAYVTGWFWIDLMSSIPFDFIFAGLDDLKSAKMLKAGRVVKALRVVRLTKLVRFLKLAVFIEKLEENFSINRNLLQLVKLLLGTVVMCHFFACMWYFFGSLDDAPGGWVYEQGVQDAATSTKYLTSFYWAVATLATVGYGDVVPVADGERTFAIIGMLLGGGYFGYIIATMASLVSKLDASTAAYHNKMDAIVSYMKSRDLPKELQMRIRKYYKHYLEKKTAFDESAMLSELSTFLRQEVAMFLINDTLFKIPIFRDRDPTFVADLITVLKPLTCSEGDFIMREGEFGREMFVLIRGELEVLHEGHALAVLGPGSYFGEMSVLYQQHFRRQATIRAVTYCEMYSLARDDLLFICRDHQQVLDNMREVAMQTYDELRRQREAFSTDVGPELDASILLRKTSTKAHNAVDAAHGASDEEIDEADLLRGANVFAGTTSTVQRRRSSARDTASRRSIPGMVEAPPVSFVLTESDSKEHPTRGSVVRGVAGPGVSTLLPADPAEESDAEHDLGPMRSPTVGTMGKLFPNSVRGTLVDAHARVATGNPAAGADTHPQVGEFAALAYRLRRQLGRMEAVVDSYAAVPESRLARLHRPESRGPGLLLVQPDKPPRRTRSRSVVPVSGGNDIRRAMESQRSGAMQATPRSFLKLSSSTGSISLPRSTTRGTNRVDSFQTDAAAGSPGDAPRLSTPEMDELRQSLKQLHREMSTSMGTLGELVRRF